MKRATSTLLLGSLLVASCSTEPTPPAASPSTADSPAAPSVAAEPSPSTAGSSLAAAPSSSPGAAAPASPVAAQAPPSPNPTQPGTCPYLSTDDVAQLNGERVGEVRLDPAANPPACLFTSANTGQEQLQVWVLVAESAAVATAAVDRAAPVESTDPAEQPEGWLGGSSGGDSAVYAVSKDRVAVVVTTDQGQSIKARRIAELVISSLAL